MIRVVVEDSWMFDKAEIYSIMFNYGE